MFQQVPIKFQPGLYANRSARSSQQRWVDGNLVRFRDGVPEQIGGWVRAPTAGATILGVPREMIAFRLNNQIGRYAGIGTHRAFYLFNGSDVTDITPVSFVQGRQDTLIGAGYGAGPYGRGKYGTRRLVAGSLLDASVWTADTFGQLLLACFNFDGKVYKYDLAAADTKLVVVPGITARAVCVSDQRHAFYFGAQGDPARVIWSDREDYTNITPSITNRAGGYNVQATSAFQCGRRVRGYVLGWTGTELFGFFPLNNTLVYGFERLGTNCGACGPQSVAVVTTSEAETAYWMGPENFFGFDGAVRELDCELRDFVFNNINRDQRAKFVARTNTKYSEIWFFYCSAGSIEIDRAVIYDYARELWTKADLSRTIWMDRGIFQNPIAMDAAGLVYEHESGDSANGTLMGSYVVSHPITIGVGQQFALVNQFWPDMQEGSKDCDLSFVTRDYPGGPDVTYGPYRFAWTDGKMDLAINARQFQFKIAGAGGKWEMGTPLLSMKGGSLR